MDRWPQDASSQAVPLELSQLVQQGVISPQALEFLKVCVLARFNLAISGDVGSGKRMLLQALVSLLAAGGEVLAIQNPDEPFFEGKAITTLRASPSAGDAKQSITRCYLLSLVPKMHPQGVVMDRVQKSEVVALLKLLFAMDGVIFSIDANSPRDTLERLEDIVLNNQTVLNPNMVQRILAGSLELIAHLQRPADGSSRIVNLTEVAQGQSDSIVLRDIFRAEETGKKGHQSLGPLRPTGVKPHFLDRLDTLGIALPAGIFT